MGLVKFCSISKSSWTALGLDRNENTIYFLKDTCEIAKGASIYSMYEGGMRYMGSLETASNASGAPDTANKTYTKGDIFVVTGSGTPTLQAMSDAWLAGNDGISGSGTDVNGNNLEAGDIVIINTTFGLNTTHTTYDLSYVNVVNKNLDTSSVITTGSLKSLTFTDSNNSIVYDPEESDKSITLSTTALIDPVVSGNHVVTGISINDNAINLETQALSIGDGVLTLNVGGATVTGNNTYSANATNAVTYDIPVMDSSTYGVAKVCGSLGTGESISYLTDQTYTYQPVYINNSGELAARIPNAASVYDGTFDIELGGSETLLTGFSANTETNYTYKIPAATSSDFGVIKVTTGNGLDNTSGTISMKLAGTTEAGTIKVSDTNKEVGTLIIADSKSTRYGVMTDTNGTAFVSITEANSAWVDRGLDVTNGKIGHTNLAVTPRTTSDIYAITHDAYGHITGSTEATALMLELGTVPSMNSANTYLASSWIATTSVNEAIFKILDQLSWDDRN